MAFVYILKSAAGAKYIGSTKNLDRRLREHMGGKVRSTKYLLPVRLYATRECATVKEATLWEKKYKRSHGQLERDLRKGVLKKIIQ